MPLGLVIVFVDADVLMNADVFVDADVLMDADVFVDAGVCSVISSVSMCCVSGMAVIVTVGVSRCCGIEFVCCVFSFVVSVSDCIGIRAAAAI